MIELRQYVLRIVSGALVCGILLGCIHGDNHETLLRMLCSIFLAILIMEPILNIDQIPDFTFVQDAIEEGQQEAQSGEAMAYQETERIITSYLETYILDKAKRKGANLTAEIILDNNHLPVQAILNGSVTNQVKLELSDIIASDLGISKENQLWTG